MGLRMVGPVIMKFGTQAQKDFYLPRILKAEDYWCQGYSEPGSGSDLASLQDARRSRRRPLCRQRLEDLDHPRPLRQPHVRAGAHVEEPRSRTASAFVLIDMDTPGITVRPIVTLGRRPRGQSGVLRRRARARPAASARKGRAGPRQVPARVRARRRHVVGPPARGFATCREARGALPGRRASADRRSVVSLRSPRSRSISTRSK